MITRHPTLADRVVTEKQQNNNQRDFYQSLLLFFNTEYIDSVEIYVTCFGFGVDGCNVDDVILAVVCGQKSRDVLMPLRMWRERETGVVIF